MRYNRFGFMSNKHNTGNATPFPSPNINITESTNSTTVTYTITSDITHLSNLAYTMSGDAVASDFSDNAISGNIELTDGNATLQKQIVIGNSTDPTFAVQLRDSANGTIFYEGNTFTVTTIGDPIIRIDDGPQSARFDMGNGTHNGANVTVARITQQNFPGNISTTSANIRFESLGSSTTNIDVLIVAGGGGAGARYNNPYSENFRSAGGGGGGEHVLTTISTSSLVANAQYPFTIGGAGRGASNIAGEGANPTLGTSGGNTSIFGITVVGGSGGEGNAQPATSNSAGIGGSSNVSYIAGGNGGDGSQLHDANSDGQDGQIGTSYDGWLPFTETGLTPNPNVTLANNIIVGSGGGSANSEVGSSFSNVPTQYGFFGTGGSARGKGCDNVGGVHCSYPNAMYTTYGVDPSPIGDTGTWFGNDFTHGDGDMGVIQLRWQSVGTPSRTIAIT